MQEGKSGFGLRSLFVRYAFAYRPVGLKGNFGVKKGEWGRKLGMVIKWKDPAENTGII